MGYDQILWLLGKERFVTEAGASNFFIIWKNKETGKPELITAPLDDKVILNGVTRRSALDLAQERLTKPAGDLEPLTISERKYTMAEVIEAHEEGRLMEAFASGTAVSLLSEFSMPVADLPSTSSLPSRRSRLVTLSSRFLLEILPMAATSTLLLSKSGLRTPCMERTSPSGPQLSTSRLRSQALSNGRNCKLHCVALVFGRFGHIDMFNGGSTWAVNICTSIGSLHTILGAVMRKRSNAFWVPKVDLPNWEHHVSAWCQEVKTRLSG